MRGFLIGVVLLSVTACKNSEQKPITTTTPTSEKIKNDTVIYDIIISFTSMGEGIDSALKKKIDAAITEYNDKEHVNSKPKKVNWGREGEVDYNISLKNLSTSKKKDFISAIKEMVGISELNIIYLDHEAVHKR